MLLLELQPQLPFSRLQLPQQLWQQLAQQPAWQQLPQQLWQQLAQQPAWQQLPQQLWQQLAQQPAWLQLLRLSWLYCRLWLVCLPKHQRWLTPSLKS
jgi:hypothetical protein